MMIVPLLVLATCFASSSHGLKIHEHMTKREIREVFSVDHDAVHKVEYEVVPVFHSNGNEQNVQLRFSAFSTDYHLYLEKNEHVLFGSKTPIYIANLLNGHTNYTSKKFPKNLRLYHDIKKRAAVALYNDENGEVQAQGVVRDDIVIRSLPSHVLKKVKREYPNIAKNDDQSERVTHHVVIRSAKSTVPNIVTKIARNFAKPGESSAQVDIVYPELLLAVDYDTFLMHGGDDEKVAVYTAAFWNDVDLRYREMDNPKIRLNIAALYISVHPNVSFVGNHPTIKCGENGPVAANATAGLVSVGEYFSLEKSVKEYDIAIAITNRVLCYKNDLSVDSKVNGLAYRAGACKHKTKEAAIIFSDKGGFEGVLVAAHEVAHSLGSPHDGDDSKDVEGGPCDFDDGYLMSYYTLTKNIIHMSHCTKTAIRKFVTSDEALCLRNKPDVGIPYEKTLPGKLLDREAQCQAFYNFSAYTGDIEDKANNCLQLYCLKPGRPKPVHMNRAPAEGTSCGPNKICLDGECVEDSTAY